MTWVILGWAGQALFFLRFCVQWTASERAGRSVAPQSFWWMSLSGSVLVGAYTLAVGEPVLTAGYAANTWIYAWNAAPERLRGRFPAALAAQAAAIALIAVSAGLALTATIPRSEPSPPWLAVAVCGQIFWSSRFIVQWIASMRTRVSHFPRSFWWTSLSGNLLLLAYTLHRGDPLLVCAFALGPIVQVRNLMLGGSLLQEGPLPARVPAQPQ